MLVGGGIVAALVIVAIVFLTNSGSQLQGYLKNINLYDQKPNPESVNFRPVTKQIDMGKVICKGEVKDSTNSDFKTISWSADVVDATPLPNPEESKPNPDSSKLANKYQLVWFMDDCGKKSGPSGWKGLGVQVNCPKIQKTAKIQVVADFEGADGKNNVKTCTVKW